MDWIWKLILLLFFVAIFVLMEYFCMLSDKEASLYDHDDAFKHLKYINKLFKNKIKYWLMVETLQSAIKNNNINKKVKDIILGANIEDCDRILEMNDLIKDDGYKFVKSYVLGYKCDGGKEVNIWRVSLDIFYHNKDIGDICFFSKFPDKISRRYDKSKNIDYWPSIYTIPEWFFADLDGVKIRDQTFPIPRSSDILLDYWYGTHWRSMTIPKIRDNKAQLKFLLEFLRKSKMILTPRDNLAELTYPMDQIEWIKKNDNIKQK